MKVIPPINVPKKHAIWWSVLWSPVIQYDPNEVTTAAKPTNAWNAATVCGSYVTATLLPSNKPAEPPTPNNTSAWVNKGAAKFNEHNAVTTPIEIPVIPNAFPILAVDWDASPDIPPIQHNDAAKYPIWYTEIIPDEYAFNIAAAPNTAGIV